VVTLQGLNGHTVVVNSISVDVVSRTEPPHGTYPGSILPCGAGRLAADPMVWWWDAVARVRRSADLLMVVPEL